ncbi:MAG: glycosyltransferase, partial [Pseudomonadota bacterium]
MSSPPTATVIVVSHGRPHELEVCLVALCRQRHRAYDIVVVADQPPVFPPTQVQCQYIPFSKRNISEARNLGLVQARGEVVAFVDDDGVPEFDWLDHLTAPFANARVGSAGGWVRGARGYAWQTQTVLVDREGWDRPLELGSTEPVVVPSMPAGLHKTTGTNCAFRRDALCALGGFDPGFAYFLEETDVNLRLAKGGWLSVAVPQAEIHHKTAPSPLRSALRVPLSLKDIGVSRGRFLSKHCPSRDFSTHLRRFSEDQWHKLDRALSLGLMTAAERDQLMEEFQTAMAAGFSARVDALDPITLCTGAIEHLQAPTAP